MTGDPKPGIPPTSEAAVANLDGARALAAVAIPLAAGDEAAAACALAPIAAQTIESHPLERLEESATATWSSASGARTRSPSITTVSAIYVRDGFACAYCARWTVPLPIMRLISLRYPREFPHHPNWKRSVAHRLYWDISTTVDHVHAVSTGGDWQAPENLQTACARCQYQKGNRSLESLGWSIRRTAKDGWDGLVPQLAPLWERLGRPVGDYERWIKAYEAAEPLRARR